MRQAGRYLPEYRELRERHGFLETLRDPALAAEVTLQPVRRFPLDAAILFSDILTPVIGMGLEVRFAPGPVIPSPVRDRRAVESLRSLDPARDVPFVAEALRRVRRELDPGIALLGFAGSPFTVAAYLVEGGGGNGDHRAVRRMTREDPETLRLLLARLADATAVYLRAQVEAGADAVQIFDTWGGLLSREEALEFDLPFVRRIVDAVRPAGVPVVLYLGGGEHLLEDAAATGVHALSVDHRLPLDAAWARLGPGVALQGNLSPAALFAPEASLREETARVVRAGGALGYVFNLGHGIWPQTPVEAVAAMLATVREVGEYICEEAAGEVVP